MERSRFFGDSVSGTIIRLVLLSIVVGIVFSALIRRIADLGFGTIEWAFTYFLLGAVVVIPIWLIVRLVGQAKRPRP
jgi:hypothetical protein